MKLHNKKQTLLLAVVIALFAVVGLVRTFSATASPARQPLAMPVADVLPAFTCLEDAPGERTCELWARQGSVDLPDGGTAPIWGFSNRLPDPASFPGPALIVDQGDVVNVILHNEIPGENISLSFTGQALVPDLTGVAVGETVTYTFTAVSPGTFKYEAGLTPNGARQVAMGLGGGLIVRPATANQAYDIAASAYDDEALLVFNELDPAFNADPNGFNMTDYTPAYWFINGKAYSQTEKILTAPGNNVLLRSVNLGLQEHSLGVLGMHQTMLAVDGSLKPFTTELVAYTLGAGETYDSMIAIPADAIENQSFAVYNTGTQQLYNNGDTSSIGGIFTFIEVNGGAVAPTGGPLASGLTVSPSPTAGNVDVTLDAILDTTATSGLAIVTWEYFLNDLGDPGTGISETLTAGTSVTVSASIPTTTLTTLPAGDVSIYVRGQDSSGTWGPVNSTVLDLVVDGPVITSLYLINNPTNGTKDVGIQATADETPSGDINVVAAEYFIDTVTDPGTGITMTLNAEAPIVSLSATIDAATITGLTHGTHLVYVRAQDALGNWGAVEPVDLEVDMVGPTSIGVGLTPNPSNGTQAVNSASNGIRLEIDSTDPSLIAEAEGFIDYVDSATNPDGSGFPLLPKDALYNGALERSYFDIPLSTIRQLSEGEHEISFHARDMAGNWGDLATLTLMVDMTGPEVSNVVASPNPTPGGRMQIVTLTADAEDLLGGTNITRVEWFVDTDPGFGNGFDMLAVDGSLNSNVEAVVSELNVSSWFSGDYTLFVRAQDAAGNWGEIGSVVLTVNGRPNPFLVDNFETGNLAAWRGVVGDMAISEMAAMEGSMGVTADLNSGAAAYLVDGSPTSGLGCFNVSFSYRGQNLDTKQEEIDIYQARDAYGYAIFGITLEQGPEGHEINAWALQYGVRVEGEGIHLNNGLARHDIKLEWNVEDGTLDLVLDGEVVNTLTDLDIVDMEFEEVWLGPASGVNSASRGSMQFDNYQTAPCGYTTFLPMVFGGNSQ